MAESKINAPGTSSGSSTVGASTTYTGTGITGDEATRDAGASARSTVDVLRAGREQALGEAKAKMRETADEQRRRAADAVGGMAGALHRAASDMKAENETMGRYTDMAAERLEEVSHYLRDTDWNEVVHGAEDFARRQPYWFVGGAMAAGFVLARFVKNSGEAARRSDATARLGQRMAASSAAGYGTSTEAGLYPPTTATTAPISSAGAAGTTAPGREV
ncbi:MAG: hypothetical protein H7Y60_01430 [Rhodospirillaceae bacterium]|nr:hypothetical protein [Rhodospirillales bacterium]